MTFFVTAYKANSPESPSHVSHHARLDDAWRESSRARQTHAVVLVEGPHGLRIKRHGTSPRDAHAQRTGQAHTAPSVRA